MYSAYYPLVKLKIIEDELLGYHITVYDLAVIHYNQNMTFQKKDLSVLYNAFSNDMQSRNGVAIVVSKNLNYSVKRCKNY